MEGVEPPTAWFVARYSIQLSYMRASNSHFINEFNKMAEKEGFEPSMGFKAHTPLAGERLRPLGHLSVDEAYYRSPKICQHRISSIAC